MIGWVIINSSFISYVSKVTIFTSPSGTVLQSVAKRRSVRRADRLDRNRRPVPTEWTSYRGLYTFTYPVPANATRIPGLSILCSLHPFLYFLRVDFVVRVCHTSPKQGFATIRDSWKVNAHVASTIRRPRHKYVPQNANVCPPSERAPRNFDPELLSSRR